MERHDGVFNGDASPAGALYSIGHGNLSFTCFTEILHDTGIQRVIDVRSYPMSRRQPYYSRLSLSAALVEAGIDYHWLGMSLGGFRKAPASSRHKALDTAGMRGYAEHMDSELFANGMDELLRLGRERTSTMLCAERRPQDCHRAFIADYLSVRGFHVIHLIDSGRQVVHRLNSTARLDHGQLIYDCGAAEQLPMTLSLQTDEFNFPR